MQKEPGIPGSPFGGGSFSSYANQEYSFWTQMNKEASMVFEPLFILNFVRTGSIALTNTNIYLL